MKQKVEQLKWMYGAFTGVCVAFFLALLGSNLIVTDSLPLFLSSLCFAALLPIFASFTLAHVYMVEERTSPDRVNSALSSKRVTKISRYSLYAFAAAFALLVLHFSVVAAVLMGLSSWVIYGELKAFLLALRKSD